MYEPCVQTQSRLTILEARAILTSCVLPPRLFLPSRSCWPSCWPRSRMSTRRHMRPTIRGTVPSSSTATSPLTRRAIPRTLPSARMTMTLRARHSWTFSTSQRPRRFLFPKFQRQDSDFLKSARHLDESRFPPFVHTVRLFEVRPASEHLLPSPA